jgi:hypothetical protein
MILWPGLLNQFKAIAVRGPDSRQNLETLGLRDVEVCGDLALALTKNRVSDPDGTTRLGVNVSLPIRQEKINGPALVAALVELARTKQAEGWSILPLAMDPADIQPLRTFCGELGLPNDLILYADPLTTIAKLAG